jgi:Ca2+-binding EF-hand superfamily protein
VRRRTPRGCAAHTPIEISSLQETGCASSVLSGVRVLRGNCGEFDMKKTVRMLGFIVLFGVLGVIAQSVAASKAAGPLRVLDSDHDGTVDLGEIKAAASALFDKLDRDHDGTLSGRELKGRLSAKELAADDHDHDGTLTKDAYLAIVEKRFKAANRDSDDRLDAKELRSRPGQALKRLVIL